MKKIISILLSAVMLTATAAVTANAATSDTKAVSADEYRYKVFVSTILPNNTLKTYTYGITAENNPNTTVKFTNDVTNNEYTFKLKNCLQSTQTQKLESGNYKAVICGGSNVNTRYNFEKTGGLYSLVRFKISDFSDYFNDNGTQTKTFDTETHDFNFTREGDGNSSQLVILSGGYINFVAPDKNGYVQAYISKKLGVCTYYTTNFYSSTGWQGGGIVRNRLLKLEMGDVDLHGGINVDDVTAIKSYSADLTDFCEVQKRNADLNYDGKIDIDDATILQKYIADLL